MKITVTAKDYHTAARARLGEVWFVNEQALLNVFVTLSEDKQTIIFDVTRTSDGSPVGDEEPSDDR